MSDETRTYQGQLEIDPHRGALYFHNEQGQTILRIYGLPVPVPLLPGDTGGYVADLLDLNLGMGQYKHQGGKVVTSWRDEG